MLILLCLWLFIVINERHFQINQSSFDQTYWPLLKQEETRLLMYKTHQLYIYMYFTISYVVGKTKMSFQDGELIKKVVTVGAESLFQKMRDDVYCNLICSCQRVWLKEGFKTLLVTFNDR
jgi:hypothetical protein